jgi:hypothetical protein
MREKSNMQYLEEMELIAMDTKKEFVYDKHKGEWLWGNRGDVYQDYFGGFKTRLEALKDAVEPYL